VGTQNEVFLLRLENFNKNWSAWVDGVETPILRVEPNFQMIPLKPGKHDITFKFSSPYHFLVHSHVVIGVLGFICFVLWLNKPSLLRRLTFFRVL